MWWLFSSSAFSFHLPPKIYWHYLSVTTHYCDWLLNVDSCSNHHASITNCGRSLIAASCLWVRAVCSTATIVPTHHFLSVIPALSFWLSALSLVKKVHFVLYSFQLIDIAMTDQFTAARRNETGLPVRLDKLLVLFRLSALPQSVFLRYLWLPSIVRRHCWPFDPKNFTGVYFAIADHLWMGFIGCDHWAIKPNFADSFPVGEARLRSRCPGFNRSFAIVATEFDLVDEGILH